VVSGYKGSTQCVVAVIRGDVDAAMDGALGTHLPYINSGDIRALVLFAKERDPLVPDLPTVGELGFGGKGLEQLWSTYAATGPPGIPKDVVEILRKALKKALTEPELVKSMAAIGRPLSWGPGDEAAKEIARLTKLFEQYKDELKK
jgi:tripartite-type tricarboxylate transporter receptor subunit TctC